MTKRVVDLTAEELDRLAGEAWFEASQSALRAGVPVVGRNSGKIVKRHPDGRTEILGGDAAPVEKIDQETADEPDVAADYLRRVRDIA